MATTLSPNVDSCLFPEPMNAGALSLTIHRELVEGPCGTLLTNIYSDRSEGSEYDLATINP